MHIYYNNTGWEIGERLFLDLPGKFKMSLIVRNSHFYEKEDGQIGITGPKNPHHAIIDCMVIREVQDADGIVYRATVPDTDRQFDEQSDFFRYCMEVKLAIIQEQEEIDIIAYHRREQEELKNKFN